MRMRMLRTGIALVALTLAWGPGVVVGGQETGPMAPLPADPPIGGFIWTVLIPAALFIGAFLGTYLLYRRFSREEGA